MFQLQHCITWEHPTNHFRTLAPLSHNSVGLQREYVTEVSYKAQPQTYLHHLQQPFLVFDVSTFLKVIKYHVQQMRRHLCSQTRITILALKALR
jgi:hypothetical protein